MKVPVFWCVYISPSPWLYQNSWGCTGLPCPLYYSPHPADTVLLLILQGWGVIKLVWDRFINPLLGELSILFRNSIVGDFWGWTVESFICRYPFPLPLGVAANNVYHFILIWRLESMNIQDITTSHASFWLLPICSEANLIFWVSQDCLYEDS